MFISRNITPQLVEQVIVFPLTALPLVNGFSHIKHCLFVFIKHCLSVSCVSDKEPVS